MAVKRSSEIFKDSTAAQLDSPPCALALSADDTWLALCSNRTVAVFEVATVLGGGHGLAPVITQPLPGAGELLMWEWSPAPGALRALALDDQGELHVMTFALPGSAAATCCCVARDPTLCSAAWASDGQSLICFTNVGQVVRFAPEDGARRVTLADAPHASIGGPAKLGLVRPLAVKAGDPLVERPVVLLAYEPMDEPDAPKVAALDLADGRLQVCEGVACIPCMPAREDPSSGQPPRRRFHAITLPFWRLAVAFSSDSWDVCCVGMRNPKDFNWQRWTLRDEDGAPSVPTFEDEANGVGLEDQYVMGLALDLTGTEQVGLIAGEEKFPPAPVVWALTSHGSLIAWTVLNKLAKPPDGTTSYPFMRQAEALPPPQATAPACPRFIPPATAVAGGFTLGGGGLFGGGGAAAPTPAPAGGFMFGPAPAPAPAGGLFGGGGMFGGGGAAAPAAAGGLFGGGGTAASAFPRAATAASLFGGGGAGTPAGAPAAFRGADSPGRGTDSTIERDGALATMLLAARIAGGVCVDMPNGARIWLQDPPPAAQTPAPPAVAVFGALAAGYGGGRGGGGKGGGGKGGGGKGKGGGRVNGFDDLDDCEDDNDYGHGFGRGFGGGRRGGSKGGSFGKGDDGAASPAPAPAGAIDDQTNEAGRLTEWEGSKRIAQQDEARSKTHAKLQSRQAKMLVGQLVRVRYVVWERAELVLRQLASASQTGPEGERAVCATIATQVIDTCTTMVDKQPGMAYALSGFVLHVGERRPVLWECLLARLQASCCYCVPYYPENPGNTDEFKKRLGYKQGETKKDFYARMAGYVTLYAALLQQSSIAQFPPQSAGNALFDRTRPDAKMQTRPVQGGFAPKGVSPMARAWAWLARLLNHPPGNITATILLAFLKPCAHALHAARPTQFVELLTFLQTTYLAKIRDKVSGQGYPAEEVAARVNLESWLIDTSALLAKGGRVPEPKEADMPEYKPPDDLRDANGGDF